MAQAKRKYKSKPAARYKQSFHGLGMLLSGMVIGSLATILWQGMQVADGGVGTGIRQMIEQSKYQEQEAMSEQGVSDEDKPAQQKTNFDFFTVLPEIEVVVPTGEPEPPAQEPESNEPEKSTGNEVQAITGSVYMLQAGSYRNKAEADRLKAELAFKGLVSSIQKISIQD